MSRAFMPFAILAGLLIGAPAAEAETEIERGRAVFEKWCVMCHGVGLGMGATQILEEKYQGSVPALLEERDDLDGEFIQSFIRDWNPGMPAFRKTEISEADARALAAYLTRKRGESGSPQDSRKVAR